MPANLLSYERRILATFILQSDEGRAEMLARMERDPKTSGPLLHAMRAVLDIV